MVTKKFQSLSELAQVKKDLQEAERQKREQARLEKAIAERLAKEATLFQDTVGPVFPVDTKGRRIVEKPKPQPVPLQRLEDDKEVLKASLSDEMDVERLLDTDDQLSFRREGIGPETVRKLRSGKWAVKGHLDLHGMRVDEARESVADFIRECVRNDLRCVRIVHGKGLGSAGKEPVLRDKVRRWLVQKEEVLAFCTAPPRDGGAGALRVLLKSQ